MDSQIIRVTGGGQRAEQVGGGRQPGGNAETQSGSPVR
jgi:hypothetical protein